MRVGWWMTGLMMSIVAMQMGNCQLTSLTTNYDAFLQAYYEWQQKKQLPSAYPNGEVPTSEQLAAFYDKTRGLATAAVQWCHQEPGLWRRFWRYYSQPKGGSDPVDLKGYVSQKPTYTPEQLRILCPPLLYSWAHYWIVNDLLGYAAFWLPSEQERVAWARHWLELSLQFYQSPQMRQGADRYRTPDPFADVPADGSILVVGHNTDFSYQAGLWRERAKKEVRIRRVESEKRTWCAESFEVLYSPVPLQQILPLDEPDYDYLMFTALIAIRDARALLQRAGALSANDWLLIAGWQVWQLPKDKAFLRVRGGELYLSRRALQQLQVRLVVAQDRVVLWNGSYRQAVRLDGKDGFREGKEVWVRLLALQEKGLFGVAEWKGFWDKKYDIRMYTMVAVRPVVEESGKQEER